MGKEKQMVKNKKVDKEKPEKELYGLEAEDSLESVNFAATENPYLNEHYQDSPEN